MAPPAGTLRVGRYFAALLAIIAVLYMIVFLGSRQTPKLGLDLRGGTEVTFTAKSPNGKAPSRSQMDEAKRILTNRVNGTGVTQSTVVVQGSNQIVVSIPGDTNTDIAKLGQAAQLSMRGLVMPAAILTPVGSAPSSTTTPSSATSGSPATTTTPSSASLAGTSSAASPKDANARPLAAASTTPPAPKTAASTTPKASATPSPSATTSAPAQHRVANPFAGLTFPIPTSEAAFQKLTAAQQSQLSAALATVDCTKTSEQPESQNYYVACNTGSNSSAQVAYLLGSVIVPGHEIKTANPMAPNPSSGDAFHWTVGLDFKPAGESAWAKYTGAHNISGLGSSASPDFTACGPSTVPCADFVGFTLDGVAIEVPVNQSAINGGTTQITGGFNHTQASDLANQLKYGALPLSFSPGQEQTVSATLGTAQLKAGLLAGGIGLILVVVYSLIYYRALGIVTIASLLVSGVLTYGCLVMLATQISFTLSLAGIAGFIVAVGITADSFVVFFERIKDEVHDGRSIRVAVPRAWVRARRTILSADTVSFLAAAILYYFAAGDVKGFAFTLGLSTILDLVVVFLFTHPLISLLSRSRTFGSARFTGLDSVRVGGIAVNDTEPEPTAPRRRPARAAAVAAQSRKAARQQDSAVAVLDADDTVEQDEIVDDVDTETAQDLPAADVQTLDSSEVTDSAGADQDTDDEDTDGEPAERVRSTPEPGSAAERAAARRARMRAERDEKGGK